MDLQADEGHLDEDDEKPEAVAETEPEDHDIVKVPANELCLLPPHVYGFSFTLKEWGLMKITSFSEIKFDENAFEHLVLEDSNKNIIKALVDSTRKDVADGTPMVKDVVSSYSSYRPLAP